METLGNSGYNLATTGIQVSLIRVSMASSNLPYRHELTSAASSYIEMDEEITSYVRERYDNQVQTKVEVGFLPTIKPDIQRDGPADANDHH